MGKFKLLYESEGSFLKNNKFPRINQNVWFLTTNEHFKEEIMQGKVIKISNIDNRGMGNSYIDIEVKDSKDKKHIPIIHVFDHKPKKKEIVDEFGKVKIWV